MKNLSGDNSLKQQQGPYFSDGQRRVDYVLAYHIRKSNSVRPEKDQDGNFVRRLRRSLSMRSSRAPLTPKEDPEIAAQDQQVDYHEDDKRFRREEFEENLLEMGLELEKDDEVRRPNHALTYWLCDMWKCPVKMFQLKRFSQKDILITIDLLILCWIDLGSLTCSWWGSHRFTSPSTSDPWRLQLAFDF